MTHGRSRTITRSNRVTGLALVATFIMILSQTILLAYDIGSAWLIVPVLIGLMVVARVGWRLIRSYRQTMLGEERSDGPWTIGDLERMRESGHISEQEFKVLREVALRGSIASALSQRSKSTSPGRRNDK